MKIPENTLLTPEQIYKILTKYKVPFWGENQILTAVEELLQAASWAIEAEVEKRLNALAPPDTVPRTFKVSLEVDPLLVKSSGVDFEGHQRARAAHMLATVLMKELPPSKRPIEIPRMMGRKLEIWTWEAVVFVKPEKNHVQT